MERQEIMLKLKGHLNELKKLGVKSLSLFGSVARDEALESSDVDLLVEFDRSVGLFDFFRLQHRIEEMLGVQRVDLLMPSAVKPALRDNILREAIRVV